ncbi:MAG: dihydroxyacetone kinase subunit DhaK [Christensenellales bacterium]|jgi:dihydroxyacetone kinase|nr:dihydroxyacetone kinase subunit DhaK [Clostridia bacterium]HRU83907.1 dihydroxyacetone kinase subunit DhaK [Eubacteriales bacterium]
MKKIINTAETFVYDMCHGIAKAHPELEFVEKYKIVKKKAINAQKVSLISGGGSGHEPAHAGFVGKGMLDAAVCGDVFASPTQIQVYNALKLVSTKKGVLMIVKNYSGDCMNFNNAAARAKEEGVKVEAVFVNDDIAVKDSLYTVGRRGVAGTVLVHKIAGAAAEQGKSLAEVKAAAEKAIANVRSFGFAFTSCITPSKGTPIFDIGPDEMEFGVGIHGEPGRKREKLQTSKELARRIVPDILADLGAKSGDEIALIINGFGATPLQELYLFNNDVSSELEAAGLLIHKTMVGNYMTSIDMAGASITVMRLDAELKSLLDYPASTPALTVGGGLSDEAAAAVEAMRAISRAIGYRPAEQASLKVQEAEKSEEKSDAVYEVEGKPLITETINTAAFVQWIDTMADIIIKNEVHFCDMDSCGDGDFGMSIAKGFKQLKADWKKLNKKDIGEFLLSASEIIMEYCGGASGPIWGSGFRSAGLAAKGKTEVGLKDIGLLLDAAVKGVQKTGRDSFGHAAEVGDKTLIDALIPAAEAVLKAAEQGDKLIAGLKKGAAAAVAGAEATRKFAAKLGRAGTVGDRSIGHPDAGAYGLGVIFTGMVKAISK